MTGRDDTFEIRRATPGESAALSELAHASKRHWGYPERWIRAWRDELTLSELLIAEHPVFAAYLDGELAGCYAVVVDGDNAGLEHLWVAPGSIGSGVGARLFRHAVEQARSRGASRLEIISDPNAAGFYARMGAQKSGERVGELEGRPRVLPIYTLTL